MRTIFLCLLILPAACAMRDTAGFVDGAATASRDVEISLSRGALKGRPILAVTIANRSGQPICIRAEALQNPYSYEMRLRLRDNHGRRVGYRPSGLIPPPLTVTTHIEAGGAVSGHYYLDSRFKRVPATEGLARGWAAQASFRYGYCGDASILVARSAWQPI